MSSNDSSASSPSPSKLHDVLGSASAGIISRAVTHPLDTVKSRLQAPVTSTGGRSNVTFRGPLDALLRTYRREGFRALYGGIGAVVLGGTPGTVLYLTSYAAFRDSISSAVSNRHHSGEHATIISSAAENVGKPSLSQGQQFAIHFSSGILAETLACVIYVPVDVVKERMQVQQQSKLSMHGASQNYKGSWDALRQIIRTEGTRGIYKGYGATLVSYGPFSALYFMFYERYKVWATEYNRQGQNINTSNHDLRARRVEDGDLPLLHLVACSAGAGALASWLTSPLEMAKLRLQVQRGQAAAAAPTANLAGPPMVHYTGMLDCLRSAYRDGGVRGLFRGAGARVIHFTPATTITMTCYEKFRFFYANVLG